MTFAERLHEIRTGFERPFWVANISELFERLSYYAAFASLARYLHESLNFDVKQASSLTGLFGGLVWFLAAFGGTLADRLGFRRSLSLAYLILSCSYFLLGSLGASWLAPIRNAMPLGVLVALVLMLPALGIALVKPCVVGTTARASKENVRSIGYSIYYTLVNIGGAAGPYVASWVHQHMSVENVFRVAAVSVFLMFFAVLLFFKEPQRSGETQTVSLGQAAKNFVTVLSNPRFMLFLLIFSGARHRATDRDSTTDGCKFSHATDTGSPRHHAGHVDFSPRVGNSDRASLSADGGSDTVRGFSRRDHPIASLLRIHFPPRASGSTGDIYGICLFTHWNRISYRGLVRWTADSSFRRGQAPARPDLVGCHCGGRGYRGTALDL